METNLNLVKKMIFKSELEKNYSPKSVNLKKRAKKKIIDISINL